MKIVIVEDDPGIRKELKQLLENAFYEAEIIEEFKDTAEHDLPQATVRGLQQHDTGTGSGTPGLESSGGKRL